MADRVNNVVTEQNLERLSYAVCGNAFSSSLEVQKDNISSSTSSTGSGTEIKNAGDLVYDNNKLLSMDTPITLIQTGDIDKKVEKDDKEAETGKEQAD